MKLLLTILFSLSFLFLTQSGIAQTDNVDVSYIEKGKELYKDFCANCHGRKGGLGLMGASNLKKSTMKTSEAKKLIKEGKGKMTPFEDVLTAEQIDMVSRYILELRK